MTEQMVVSLIALAAVLLLAMSALRSREGSGQKTVRLALL